jgi:hypothetical protein
MSDSAEDVFQQIETLMAEQLERLRGGNVTAAVELGRRTESLLRKATAAGGQADLARIERIKRLFHDLRLALAQQAGELADKRSRLGKTRKALKAYRNGAG